ncbi:MAG: ABC transporter permease [Phycisphaerales bacterium]|nr:ABC transporter permease [Phycisphaerales bacterium]
MAVSVPASRLDLPRLFGFITAYGRFTRFCLSSIAWLFRGPSIWLHWRLLAPQLLSVGVASIPVVGVTGAFIGMILALETFVQFEALGLQGTLGSIINVSVVKQIGPVLAAVMVAGRVGGALTAELGTMRVTEQLDALRAMATDPIAYLVVPRVIACAIMTPILTIYSDMLGVFGGYTFTVLLNDVPAGDYWSYSAAFVTWYEPIVGIVKAFFFGLSIGIICCYKGFSCKPGAAGVGKATTQAFVASFLSIIVINLVLAKFLNTIQPLFFPNPEGLPF